MKANKRLLVLAFLILTGCGKFEISIEPVSTEIVTLTAQIPADTAVIVLSPTEQVNPTATLAVPSPTITIPSPTSILPIATQVPPTSTSAEQIVKIFLIALNDNGQSGVAVGCGDSAIPVTVTIPPTQGVLKAALEKLLSAKKQFYGQSGLYNALYQSDLQVAGVTIEQGKAIVHLTGTMALGGECDAPRFEAQIKQTALQFSTVNDVAVFINDKPLEDVLSLK